MAGIWDRRARRAGQDGHGGAARRRSASRCVLLGALLGAAAALTLTGPSVAPARSALRAAARSEAVHGATTTTTTSSKTTASSKTTTSTRTASGGGSSAQAPALPKQFCVVNQSATNAPAVCAPAHTLSGAEKANARTQLRSEVQATAVICGAPLTLTHKGVSGELGAGLAKDLTFLCPTILELTADTLIQVDDPPLAGYEQAALIVDRGQTPPPGVSCPSSVSSAACDAIRSASSAYAADLELAVEVAGSASLTTDRFGGAVAAHSASGAFLQASLGDFYAGALDGSLVQLQKASAALGAAYSAAGLDFTVPAAAAVAAITSPSGTVLTPTLLGQLVADGVATTPAAARAAIVAELDTANGSIDASATLAAPLPAVGFSRAYFAMDLSNVRAIVKGLVAQGTLAGPVAKALNGDLARAGKACGKPAFAAAITSFTATAETAGGGVATILPYAARPLLESTITPATCL